MKRYITLVTLGLSVALLTPGSHTVAQFDTASIANKKEEIKIEDLSPIESISYYADLYDAPKQLLISMGTCESQFNPNKIGDNGLAKNIYQYHYETFIRHSKIMGETLDWNSYQDQSKLISWISVHRPDLLKEWTSYVAIKNGGTYSFYSKLLQKNFIVKCTLLE